MATTSVWLKDTTRRDQLHDIFNAYAKTFPTCRSVHPGGHSEGSEILVRAADASDEPLWVPAWEGASVLPQALWHVNATRSHPKIEKFVAKLRVYTISDQDNTSSWIRQN
ncbi:cellulose-binding protein [Colletotrichum incanum]|uniref:Cellulose-binding protein n=1 Tax=Colletotrichum incanum TaxID=1573173 RepID=A0A162P8I8_COLIC|nr:cellulose-binding protein [Colletotrichum incanum]